MGYMGFEKVKAEAKASGARNPAAVAADAGREKYGKKKYQSYAAKGKKMRGVSAHDAGNAMAAAHSKGGY